MLRIKFRDNSTKTFDLSPTRLVVFSFIFLILTGTALLNLPIMSNDGRSVGILNALFTSTSASCVTGLIIADTATQWSIYGQLVILFLIQAGGLGIITLTTFFSVVLGRKVGLKGMLLAQESLNYFSFEGVLKLIKRVVLVTFGIEIIGAMILSISFVPDYGPKGFYMGIFHSVSAFCNAGFDIMGKDTAGFSKGLTEYNGDPIVVYTIPLLIIIGGLGFMVWKDLFEYRKTKSLLLHTKVVLIVSLCLIIFGAIFIFAFEYNNPETMGKLDNLYEKANSAFFHSVSSRTAGYNTLPLDKMNEISKAATVFLMFIGAAPGSTAGGVKVTTFAVVLMAIVSQIKGANGTLMFRKKVPHHVVSKALAIMGLSGMLVITITTIILAVDKKPFIDVLYESTSAFGTVGLSSVGTPFLSSISKLFLILTMFLGRVGPLSFAIALTLRANRSKVDVVYPEGKIVVG
ncbi:MAG: TrkH family potassium uptake protein [Clostridia bacterium]|nr:TrkH family potassium uptake protein [Clostridia bacterium]